VILGPPNLASTVERFSMAGLVERTYGPDSTTAEGMIAAGAVVDTPLVAHIFPAPGDTVARLELQGGGAVVEVHVPERGRVRAVRKGSQDRGTVIVWLGRTYEVQQLGEWYSGADGSTGYQQAWAQEVVR